MPHDERAIVREFERRGWIWVVTNPIELAVVGPPTQERRHAIYGSSDESVGVFGPVAGRRLRFLRDGQAIEWGVKVWKK